MSIQLVGYDSDGQPIYGDSNAPGDPNNNNPFPVNSYAPTPVMPGADPTGGGKYGASGGYTGAAPINPANNTGIVIPSYNNPGYQNPQNNTGISFPSYANPADKQMHVADDARIGGNAGFENNIPQATKAASGAIDNGLDWQNASVHATQDAGTTFNGTMGDALSHQIAGTGATNAKGQSLVDQQGSLLGGLAGQDQQALGQFHSALDPSNFSGDYQAIGYDPEGLAAQQQALSNFSSIQGGSLDYQASQAQAAHAAAVMAAVQQYKSNPGDVAQQQDAINQLKGAINGGEWNDSLRDVRDKYKSLSDPEITDQERFMMEQFRQNSEGQMRSNREALNTDLAQRGIRSGASEQVGLGAYNQQVGGDRVLTELGAGANAINRSMAAMSGWDDASAQGRQAELQAMGMYSDAAGNLRQMNDQVGEFNAAEQNQTNRVNATNATNVNISNAQNDTDVSMFNANSQNQAKANNQATRVAGAQGYSTAATNLRNSNETINMFNKDQQMVQERHQDQVVLDRASEDLNGTLATNSQIGGFVTQQTATALGENQQGWLRDSHDTDEKQQTAVGKYGTDQDLAGAMWNYGGAMGQGGVTKASLAQSEQDARIKSLYGGAGVTSDATKIVLGDQANTAASEIAKKQSSGDDSLSPIDFIPYGGAISKGWQSIFG